MPYLGSWKVDDLLTFPAITHRFDTGALTDADAVPAYRIYEDETGTAILTGNMAKLDDANTTGFYSEQITLSAANGFEKGKCYTVYITAAVNSVTGGQHHTFQIEAEVDANVVSDAAGIRSAVGLAAANLDTQLDALPTAAEVVDAVLDEDMTAHQTQGSLGQAIGDPGADTDSIWALANTNLNATVGSRASQTSVDDLPTNAELTTALASADDVTLAAIAALNNLSAAQVNAEVVDALNVDTYAEPGQGAPAATASLVAKLGYLYKAWRNRHTQTATQYSLYADDATTVDQKATVADDGTTASRTEIASGP